MIPRAAAPTLERLARGFPLVALTGPRQSGKTTLAKSVFSEKAYVSLENPDEREFALQDPKRFLKRFSNGQRRFSRLNNLVNTSQEISASAKVPIWRRTETREVSEAM